MDRDRLNDAQKASHDGLLKFGLIEVELFSDQDGAYAFVQTDSDGNSRVGYFEPDGKVTWIS